MREDCVTEFECMQACNLTPLAKLTPTKQHSIRDLLLSNMAVGSGITLAQVTTALNELIDLKYPLINRILEIAAYFCSIKGLNIYCANPTEYSSLNLRGDDVGYFNSALGLIIVSTRIPLSQNLIHELAHAIRFFIGNAGNTSIIRHSEFCKKKILFSFQSSSDKQSIDSRRESRIKID